MTHKICCCEFASANGAKSKISITISITFVETMSSSSDVLSETVCAVEHSGLSVLVTSRHFLLIDERTPHSDVSFFDFFLLFPIGSNFFFKRRAVVNLIAIWVYCFSLMYLVSALAPLRLHRRFRFR